MQVASAAHVVPMALQGLGADSQASTPAIGAGSGAANSIFGSLFSSYAQTFQTQQQQTEGDVNDTPAQTRLQLQTP